MIRVTLERAWTNNATATAHSEVDLGEYDFVEIQDGWVSLWRKEPDGLALPIYTIDAHSYNRARIWTTNDDITEDNWLWEANRVNILLGETE